MREKGKRDVGERERESGRGRTQKAKTDRGLEREIEREEGGRESMWES